MADLDSFFARKDKRKLKGKNFSSTDEIARRLEETEKKLEKELQKETPIKKPVEEVVTETTVDGVAVVTTVVNEVKPLKKEEEEWNDFEDKDSKDLTDLKISRLQIEDEEDGAGGGGAADDGDEDGDGDDKKDGVWKTEKPPPPPPIPEVEPEVVEEPNPSSNSTASSYVPPHMRHSMASVSPLPRGGGHRKSKLAPDITNEMAFPSLSNAQASNPAGAWGKKNKFDDRQGFENVRHGSSRAAQDDFSSPKLSTANRFDALTDHS